MIHPKTFFLYTFLLLIFFTALLIGLLLFEILSPKYFKSILLGEAITTFNAAIGFLSIKSGINKPEKMFLRWLLGGMVLRFLTTLVIVILALLFLELNRISFIFSILFFYSFFLIIEIIYLNFHQN